MFFVSSVALVLTVGRKRLIIISFCRCFTDHVQRHSVAVLRATALPCISGELPVMHFGSFVALHLAL